MRCDGEADARCQSEKSRKSESSVTKFSQPSGISDWYIVKRQYDVQDPHNGLSDYPILQRGPKIYKFMEKNMKIPCVDVAVVA